MELPPNQPKPKDVSGSNADLFILLTFTLLPCLIMWFGLYVLKSAFWTIAVYHIFCLLPIIIWRWQLWRGSLKWPKMTDLAVLFATSIVFAAGAVALYKFLGDLFLDSQQTFELLIRLGYRKTSLIAMAIYFIFVNSALEELFWRGVIFNRLEQLRNPLKTIGIIWSFVAYAIFHYPIMRLVLFPGWAEFGTLLLALYGAGLALIYRRSGSIILASLCHAMLTDLTAIVLIVALFNRLHVGT